MIDWTLAMFGPTKFILPDPIEATETVYLLQYSTWGHHSLAFHKDGQLIEFTYGDWALFALDKRDWFTSISHMVFPTMGALGRKAVPWHPDQAIPPLFTDCIQAVPFEAEQRQVNYLFTELSDAFKEAEKKKIFHQEDAIWFVPYPIYYGVWNNCNHELAKWLIQLGGSISGRIFWNPDFVKGMQPPKRSVH